MQARGASIWGAGEVSRSGSLDATSLARYSGGVPIPRPAAITCTPQLELRALPGVPLIAPGDDVAALVMEGLQRADLQLRDGDVLVITSKAFSRAENRFVDLQSVDGSQRAIELAAITRKDPRVCRIDPPRVVRDFAPRPGSVDRSP